MSLTNLASIRGQRARSVGASARRGRRGGGDDDNDNSDLDNGSRGTINNRGGPRPGVSNEGGGSGGSGMRSGGSGVSNPNGGSGSFGDVGGGPATSGGSHPSGDKIKLADLLKSVERLTGEENFSQWKDWIADVAYARGWPNRYFDNCWLRHGMTSVTTQT